MVNTISTAATSHLTATHPGWIIESADGWPYGWYVYDAQLSYDEESAMKRFEPDPTERRKLLARGYVARRGPQHDLFAQPSIRAVKASA